MYVVIRKFYHMRSMAGAARRTESDLDQILKQSPGFVSYYPYLSEFGGKNHLIPTAGNGLSDHLLVLAPAVHVGRIEKSHALVERIADERDGLLVVALTIDAGEGHAAEAEG
jgi:hypothetical protein